MAMEGWSWQPALLTLGAAALLARLLFFGGRRSESSAQLGSPPPAAFDRAADRVTAARRVEGAQKMRTLGPPPRAQELVDGMASGSLTVEGVVGDMLERARVAHEMTHAVVPCKPLEADGSVRTADDDKYNPLGADALTRAKELDGYDRRRRGPLHGLPFSVKECFQLQGTDSTAGLGKFKSQDGVADRTPTRNAPLIDALLDAGAVPIAKTNVPQLMYSFECENPIYGRTSTPSSELLIPGGSSGGEAALIASGGSVVGIGTDIGGSCRTPAHMSGCCGANIAFLARAISYSKPNSICQDRLGTNIVLRNKAFFAGIKPARNRLSGVRKSPTLIHGAQSALASVPGVLGRHADDIATLYQGVLTERGIKIMRAADPQQALVRKTPSLLFGGILN
jgi:hypothetical protein